MIKKIKHGVSVLSISMLLGFNPVSMATESIDDPQNTSQRNSSEKLDPELSNRSHKLNDKDLLSLKIGIPLDFLTGNTIGRETYFLRQVLDHIYDNKCLLNRNNINAQDKVRYQNLAEMLEIYDTPLPAIIRGKLHQIDLYENPPSFWRVTVGIAYNYFSGAKSSDPRYDAENLIKLKATQNNLFNVEVIFKHYQENLKDCIGKNWFTELTSMMDPYPASKEFQETASHYMKDFSILDLSLIAHHLQNKDLKDFFIKTTRERIQNELDPYTKMKHEIYLSIADDSSEELKQKYEVLESKLTDFKKNFEEKKERERSNYTIFKIKNWVKSYIKYYKKMTDPNYVKTPSYYGPSHPQGTYH